MKYMSQGYDPEKKEWHNSQTSCNTWSWIDSRHLWLRDHFSPQRLYEHGLASLSSAPRARRSSEPSEGGGPLSGFSKRGSEDNRKGPLGTGLAKLKQSGFLDSRRRAGSSISSRNKASTQAVSKESGHCKWTALLMSSQRPLMKRIA
jgi:hypothetical protein